MTSIVYIHGIKADTATTEWASALESALRRRGRGGLATRGIRLFGPAWREELDGPELDTEIEAPDLTYRRSGDDEYDQAVGRWSLKQAELERALLRRGTLRSGPLGLMPNDALDRAASPVAERVLSEVGRYCRDASRRNACLHAVLQQIPENDDLVVIAHSLGSVLALDVLYHLPPGNNVKLLVTVGSPLGREVARRHLRRVRDRFPAERVGPWLNVVGQWDPVAAGRGIAGPFPEALDVFVDTGMKTSHFAAAYLDQDVIADAIDVALTPPPSTGGVALEQRASDWHLPALVQSQMALRIEQRMQPGDRRRRFGLASAVRAAEMHDQLEAGPSLDLSIDNSERLRGRFTPGDATAVLLATCMSNVITPYEIDYEGKAEERGLEDLASDMGYPTVRARYVLSAELEARSYHGAKRGWQKKALLAAGLAALVAAPYLVAAAAPAGLAGGAGVVAGLAALGPGGMVGGLGMVGLVGGAGGAAIAGGLTTGSAAMVEEKVIYLHALALAERKLDEAHHRAMVWKVLIEMETALATEATRLERFSDDRARVLKELEQKQISVAKAIDALTSSGLGPAMLETAEDDDNRARPFVTARGRLTRGG